MSNNQSPNNGFGKQGKNLLKSMAGRQMSIIKRRVIRGLGVLAMAGVAWAATQMGLLSDKGASDSSSANDPVETLRLADPLERGEDHAVTDETKTVKTWTHKRSNDNAKIAELFKAGKSDTWVTAYGKVGKVLPDDNKGSRHQRFLMDIGQQKWLLVAHNIDLAPYVPLRKGDALVVYGEYEYNEKGGVIHWTHHDPRGYKDGGYIEHNNKRYE